MFFNLAPSVMPFFLRIALRVEPFSNANCGYLIPTHHKLSLLLKGIHKKHLEQLNTIITVRKQKFTMEKKL